MRTDNNGKIAIAIVAMFVVALSVVGFTYAYFTAQVRGNTALKSVEVTAGRLEVLYDHGNVIRANNIVPGWVSDGTYYYDPVYSTKVLAPDAGATATKYKIVAVNTAVNVTCTDGTTNSPVKDCSDAVITTPSAADGIITPVTFTVSNTANNTADSKYIIVLKNITNGIAAADQENLKVTLYSGTFNVSSYKSATPIWSGTLSDTTTSGQYQIIVPSVETIAYDANNLTASNSYYLTLTYVNAADTAQNEEAGNQDDSQGVSVSASVEIIGVEQNNSNWYDADGNQITFPTANTTAPSNGLSY